MSFLSATRRVVLLLVFVCWSRHAASAWAPPVTTIGNGFGGRTATWSKSHFPHAATMGCYRHSRSSSNSHTGTTSSSSYSSRSTSTSTSTTALMLSSSSSSSSSSTKSTSSGGRFGFISNYVSSRVRRIRNSLLNKERSNDELKLGIAGFYDRSSKLWEDVWGEHMHHGYYVPENRTDHVQAQIDLIDEVLKWSKVTSSDDDGSTTNTNNIQSVVDVGCGIGGSSRHIAKLYNCSYVRGITLSPYQAQRATELAQEQGLAAEGVSFQVADALAMPFPDDTFDLVWSLESGEHMPDKRRFVQELLRVCRPGGRIIVVTWCHRDLNSARGETILSPKEERLLRKINRAYYLPRWCSVDDYVQLFETEGNVTDIRRADWSHIIAPFWKAVIRSSLNVKSIVGLARSGFSTMRGAYAMWLMLRGFDMGLIKFGLITCTKPMTATTTTSMKDENEEDAGEGQAKEIAKQM